MALGGQEGGLRARSGYDGVRRPRRSQDEQVGLVEQLPPGEAQLVRRGR